MEDCAVLPKVPDRLSADQRKQFILETAAVLADELGRAADQSPDGKVLDACEDVLLGAGREFLRRCLSASLQSQAEAVEKKEPPREPVRADARGRTRAKTNAR